MLNLARKQRHAVMNSEHNANAGSDWGNLPGPRPQAREHPHQCGITHVSVEYAYQRQPEDDLHCATLRYAIILIVSALRVVKRPRFSHFHDPFGAFIPLVCPCYDAVSYE